MVTGPVIPRSPMVALARIYDAAGQIAVATTPDPAGDSLMQALYHIDGHEQAERAVLTALQMVAKAQRRSAARQLIVCAVEITKVCPWKEAE